MLARDQSSWMPSLCVFVALCTFAICQSPENNEIPNLEEVFAWDQLDYNFGEESAAGINNRFYSGYRPGKHIFSTALTTTRRPRPAPAPAPTAAPAPAPAQADNETAFYIPYNNLPMGVSRWRDRLFVTLPRRRYGIPATLNYLSLTEDRNTKSPGLRPYPSLYANSHLDRTRTGSDLPIVSVYRTDIDSCDRLWMVDNGLLEVPNANQQLQPPAVVIIDLNTNTILRRFEIPPELIIFNTTAGLASITVDIDGNDCENAHAYLPDLYQYGMIVYSFSKNRAWRVRHNYFFLDPLAGDYNVNGLRFQWSDGVFSVALTARQAAGDKMAIFHSMSGSKEYGVSTDVFKNETLAARSFHGDDFQLLGERGSNTQTAKHDLDEATGVLFYGQVGRNALVCWNTAVPFSQASHVTLARDDNLLQYPSDVFIDAEGDGWVMSNRLPMYNYRGLDATDVNYRIHRFNAATIIAGTACAAPTNNRVNQRQGRGGRRGRRVQY